MALLLAAAVWTSTSGRVEDASLVADPARQATNNENTGKPAHRAAVADRLLRRAPLHSDAWLDLASAAIDEGQAPARVSALLQMSYLVAPGDRSIISRRLMLAVKSTFLSDRDVQEVVRSGVQVLEMDGRCNFDEFLQPADAESRKILSALIKEVSLCRDTPSR